MSFETLGVQPALFETLKRSGIVEPTPIQEKTIPPALEGKDVIGISKTGSGKTCAFGVPVLQKVKPQQGVQALILAPTRDLAVQISRNLFSWSRNLGVRIATVYGGVSIIPQMEQVTKSEIVVGTPGRVLDHLQRRTLDLSKVTIFVLDEADKMVDMGFIEDVEKILRYTPQSRQIMLFGATISDEVEHLKRNFMKTPVIAKTETQVHEEYLEQYYIEVKPQDKFSLLVHLLKREEQHAGGALIFCSTRDTVDLVGQNLHRHNIKADSLHGKLSQNKRQRIIDNFNSGKLKILVASTVAARGLHIEGVTHVFNYDLPKDPQEYIHRIGRTARAGESGKAITLLTQRDHQLFSAVLRRYALTIHKMEREEFERLGFDTKSREGSSRDGNRHMRHIQSRHERADDRRHPRPVSAWRPKQYTPGTGSWREKDV